MPVLAWTLIMGATVGLFVATIRLRGGTLTFAVLNGLNGLHTIGLKFPNGGKAKRTRLSLLGPARAGLAES